MSDKTRALLLVNVGTPDKPKTGSVRRYLSQFLNDARVIDIPWLGRTLLVNGIIVPFRAKKSARLYQKLWTEEGSPLLIHLENLAEKLQENSGDAFTVFGAMRYGNPSMKDVLNKIRREQFDEIVVFPLYPHYASSTTGSVVEEVMERVGKWNVIPAVRIISQYYSHPSFLSAFAEKIKSYRPEEYDRILFSYHGLPVRQVEKVHPSISEAECSCEMAMPEHGTFCYKATCYETTRLLVKHLGLDNENVLTAFQSRLSKNWLKPFTDETIQNLAEQGHKKVLVVAPSFVSDCLETTIEIGDEYKELFEQNGGEKLTLVESLNSDDRWVEAVKEIAKDESW